MIDMFMPQCTFLVELKFLSCSDVAVCTSSYPQTILKNRLSEIFFFLLKEQWTGYATQIIPLKQLFSYCLVCLFVCLLFGFVFGLNQLDPLENVEVEIKKNKISRSVDETAQAVLNAFISFISHLLNSLRLILLYV